MQSEDRKLNTASRMHNTEYSIYRILNANCIMRTECEIQLARFAY